MTAQYAAGKVTIGFSNPYVATYSAEGGTIKFGTPTVLARGVSVQIEPESSDDNNFYADNHRRNDHVNCRWLIYCCKEVDLRSSCSG